MRTNVIELWPMENSDSEEGDSSSLHEAGKLKQATEEESDNQSEEEEEEENKEREVVERDQLYHSSGQPSLTPTPQPYERNLTGKEQHEIGQLHDNFVISIGDGPAICGARDHNCSESEQSESEDEPPESEEDERADDPNWEYFDDPDTHDERPERLNSTGETSTRSSGSTDTSHSDLSRTTSLQVTASEARPEQFFEDSASRQLEASCFSIGDDDEETGITTISGGGDISESEEEEDCFSELTVAENQVAQPERDLSSRASTTIFDEATQDAEQDAKVINCFDSKLCNYYDKLIELITNEALKQLDILICLERAKQAEEVEEKDLIVELSCQLEMSILEESIEQLSKKCYYPNDWAHNEPASGFAERDFDVAENLQDLSDLSGIRRRQNIYNSSMYFDDRQNTYPTIDKQVKLCKEISANLQERQDQCEELKSRSKSRGRDMFIMRRERFRVQSDNAKQVAITRSFDCDQSEVAAATPPKMVTNNWGRRCSLPAEHLAYSKRVIPSWTTGTDIVSNKLTSRRLSLENHTDTEYEAPQIKLRASPARATTSSPALKRRNKLAREVIKFAEMAQPPASLRPYLDASSLKSIELLRNIRATTTTAPEPDQNLEVNEHQVVSPQLCSQIARSLSQPDWRSSRGAILFAKRKLESPQWILGADLTTSEQSEHIELEEASFVREPSLCRIQSSPQRHQATLVEWRPRLATPDWYRLGAEETHNWTVEATQSELNQAHLSKTNERLAKWSEEAAFVGRPQAGCPTRVHCRKSTRDNNYKCQLQHPTSSISTPQTGKF